MGFQRTLNIKCGNTGRNPITLLLCFKVPDPSKLYYDQYPVAWRVSNFTGKDHEDMSAAYSSELIHGDFVKPSLWKDIDLGQHTTSEQREDGSLRFTRPVKESGKVIIAENATKWKQNFAIGMVEGNNTAVSLLYSLDIGEGSSLAAQFTPILQAYVVSDYQEQSVLKGAIQTMEPFWTQDLAEYNDEAVNLVFQRDVATGAYSIEQA